MAIQFLTQFSETAGEVSLSPLNRVLELLQAFGFFKVVLPFLLIFTLVYAVILKSGVFGEPSTPWVKPVATIIAFVAGFLVVTYTPVVKAIETFVPQVGFLLLVVVLLLLVLGMVGIPITKQFGGGLAPAALIIVLAVVMIFLAIIGSAVGPQIPALYTFSQFMMGIIPIELTTEQIALLLSAAIIIGIPTVIMIIIYYATR